MDEKQLSTLETGVVELRMDEDELEDTSIFIRACDIGYVQVRKIKRWLARSPQDQREVDEIERAHAARYRERAYEDAAEYRPEYHPDHPVRQKLRNETPFALPPVELPARLAQKWVYDHTCSVVIRPTGLMFSVKNSLEELQGYLRNS